MYLYSGLLSQRKGHLYNQVPEDQERAQPSRREKRVPRRAGPLSRLLELLVAAPDVLRDMLRVRHKLVDLRRLSREVARQQRLQLCDLQQRLLRRPASECPLAKWSLFLGRGAAAARAYLTLSSALL